MWNFKFWLFVNCIVMWYGDPILGWLGVANGLLCIVLARVDNRMTAKREEGVIEDGNT